MQLQKHIETWKENRKWLLTEDDRKPDDYSKNVQDMKPLTTLQLFHTLYFLFFWFFFFQIIHRIKNALKKGGGLHVRSRVNNTNHIQFLGGK